MKKFKLLLMLLFAAMILSTACAGGGGSDDPDNPEPPIDDKIISISIIDGVIPPAYGEIPIEFITETEEFEGIVSWDCVTNKFAASKVYTATIELNAKNGFTLNGINENYFKVAGASSVKNDADSGVVTAVFPATGSVFPTVVNMKAVSGVTPPVRGVEPVATITESAQFIGNVRWEGSPHEFEAKDSYTAIITLTPKPGFTFSGVGADYFTISGSISAKNNANSGVITAVFPVSEPPVLSIEDKTISFPSGTFFKMIITPDIVTTNKFPYNIDCDLKYDELTDLANVPSRFMIADTEVTYELWKEVYTWATSTARGSNRYYFANPGLKGNDGAADKTVQHPVSTVSWRDAIVWCNALTDYYNSNNGSETDLVCVYAYKNAVLRDSRNSNAAACDAAVATSSANGFRLPTCLEWEFAARYIGSIAPAHNNISLKDNVYYTNGSSASGAVDEFTNQTATTAVAIYDVKSTAVVKSKLPNSLGIYDMSGNLYEWCFDYSDFGSNYFRVFRGGTYIFGNMESRISFMSYGASYNSAQFVGFRFVRSY